MYDPAIGTWTATGSMGSPRTVHTATLLPSGQVLVAGGINTSGYLSTAELYDPASGLWTATGSMGTARFQDTATLLPSGQVLVAGGYNGNALSSVEVYDPATGTWTATADIGAARYLHKATLLPSGQVLVAGGVIPSDPLNSKLYDPATGSWSHTGRLTTARTFHTATLLPSGNVLVVGGHFLSSAELYDPGLAFDPNWQPLLTMVSPFILPGGELTASGSRFQGISEASGGNGVQNSSSNYPLVELLSLINEQTLFLPVDTMAGWSDTSFTSAPITLMTNSSSGFPIGYALVTVFTNGIPSQSQLYSPQHSRHPQRQRHSKSNTNSHVYSDHYANSYSYIYTHGYCDLHADAYRNSDGAFTPTDATFTPTPTATATATPTPTSTARPTPNAEISAYTEASSDCGASCEALGLSHYGSVKSVVEDLIVTRTNIVLPRLTSTPTHYFVS